MRTYFSVNLHYLPAEQAGWQELFVPYMSSPIAQTLLHSSAALCQRLLSAVQKIAHTSCPAGSVSTEAELCHLSARVQVKKPGMDGQSPLPHVFSVRVTARFGVAALRRTTS